MDFLPWILLYAFVGFIGVCAIAYRTIGRPLVRSHFGDKGRHYDARRCRRSFEGQCGSAFTCLMLSNVVRAAVVAVPGVPAYYSWLAGGALLLVALAFGYAAYVRWSDPYAD